MVNEATLVYRKGNPVDYIVADGTAITKGALLKMTDPMTAIASTTEAAACAGIAARDKVASDGHIRLAVYNSGTFRMTACGAIVVGNAVMAAGVDNLVKQAPPAFTACGAVVLGYAKETIADLTTGLIELNLAGGSG